MAQLNFNSENLMVDWISFNIEGLIDSTRIANLLFFRFNASITMEDQSELQFYDRRNKYDVSIRQRQKSHWVGSQIIFSGKNAAYFYKLIKTQKFNLDLLKFGQRTLSLGRIDLCFSKTNYSTDTKRSFDAFLVDSRSQIQNHTNTRHIRLYDFPDGKMLKVNRRNNSRHYRVYQKDGTVRFELELKHRQTKLVQGYLFNNQLDVFEHQLVIQYFRYSNQVLRSDYSYTDWVLDFQRRHQATTTFRPLVISYLENQVVKTQEEEERLFHLLQFLSFVKSLKLNPFKDCQRYKIKNQFYYELKFPLIKFLKFTGMRFSNHCEREKLIFYFYQLQKLDPIVKVFSNMAFRSYVCFPHVDCANPSGNSWTIEVLAAEELFCYPYPFHMPTSFLRSTNKNDLRLKVLFMKSLAISGQKKILYLERFFNTTIVRNDQLIQIKKNIIQLLDELVENKIIQNEVEIVLKSNKKKYMLVQELTISDITRRIKYLQLYETLQKIG